MNPVQEGPAEQAQDQNEQAQGGGVQELIVQTDSNLSKLAMILSKAPGLPPGLAEGMGKLREGYTAIVEQLLGGGAQQAPASATMEQGASNAQPFSHAGVK